MKGMAKKIPLRMCVVCKKMLPKSELTRVTHQKDGTLMLDLTGKLAGRGAYICSNSVCRTQLRKKRMLNKSFRTAVPEEIYDTIASELHED